MCIYNIMRRIIERYDNELFIKFAVSRILDEFTRSRARILMGSATPFARNAFVYPTDAAGVSITALIEERTIYSP